MSCRRVLRPGCAGKESGRWPDNVELAAAAGPRGLVPRGTVFERHVHDPVEPRRSGTYEFCVVGVDFASSGQLHYHAWEPTGHFDRTFAFDEIDRILAVERFGRSVGLGARATGPSTAVRWIDAAEAGSLLHSRQLPELDERGRPVLPPGSRFSPRNSTDLLGPMLLQWKHNFAQDTSQLLVLDGTGRFAAHVQDEFPAAEVRAIDDPQRLTGAMLKLFRERSHFPVCEKTLDCSVPAIRLPDGAVSAVLLPFVLRRLCGADDQHFLALLREALRVAREHVLLAEDAVAPHAGEAALRRWKALLHGGWSVPVLFDGELRSGPVPDHFLSEPGGGASCTRRFLILQATHFEHSSRSCRQAASSPRPGGAAAGSS